MSWTKAEARAELGKIPYVPAKHKTTANRVLENKIRLVVMHDMEAPEDRGTTAEGVARYFQTIKTPASAHVNVDRDSEVRSVRDKDIAYHAPGASHDGIGIEQAGYARQTRAEWLDIDSTKILRRSSRIAGLCCVAYNIPARWLTNDELRAGHKGIVHHLQVSQVYRRSTHWDCGYQFPTDVFMSFVWQWMGEDGTPDDLPDQENPMAKLVQPDSGPDADDLFIADGGVISYVEDVSHVQHYINLGLLVNDDVVKVPLDVFNAVFTKVGSTP